MLMRVLFSLLLVLGCAIEAQATEALLPQDKVLEQAAAPTGGDFTLQSIEGPISTRDLRGKVLMLYFGYTKCPDVCPSSLAFITQALHALSPDELDKVVSIFISVDPKRDNVQALADYVAYFHENFIGLTGSADEIAAVARRYGAQYSEVDLPGSAFGYSVNHSSATYLVDKKGELRFVFPHQTLPSIMLEGLRYLMAEGS
jgi:protein SCO1/2